MIILALSIAIFFAFALGLFVGCVFSYVKTEELEYEAAQRVWRELNA